MGFKCGIVGLPNVGKSTLFNALTRTAAAQAANYPFCTIEPNTGDVAVPDPRLFKLAELARSKTVVPTRLTFVDIAGLVRGASKGEGLGNQFLGNIREVDAIAHVLRCFEDGDVTHVDESVDPLRDVETVETELGLADLETLERRLERSRRAATMAPPPFPPEPANTVTRAPSGFPSMNPSLAKRARCRPAFSIIWSSPMPYSSTMSRSTSRI